MRGHLIAVVLVCASACRCRPPIDDLPPAELYAEPARLVLPAAWVGQTTRATLKLGNRGGATAEGEVSIAMPFATVTRTFSLTRGDSQDLVVELAPLAAGTFTATLQAGELGIEVVGEGRQPPPCTPSGSCRSVRFDFEQGACVETVDPDGTACMNTCIAGACATGRCLGQLIACDDHDACTLDNCSVTDRCSHLPQQCTLPAMPCKVSRCDPAVGCLMEDATDGTLCGPDDCTSSTVDLCLTGQCVNRPRPPAGRCANRWVVTSPPARPGAAAAYDALRGHLVVFGGFRFGDTWQLYGNRWVESVPVSSPPPRGYHAMAWDSARGRIVMFGGEGLDAGVLADTWEWDGTNWLERAPLTSPPGRKWHAMTYDSARRRVLLVGGSDAVNAPLDDTWEWNGITWTRRMPANVPPGRQVAAMAYDEGRQRAVLLGAFETGNPTTPTWEWDGTDWQRRAPDAGLPPRYSFASMAYDSARARVVAFTSNPSTLPQTDVWEYDGATWLQRPQPAPAAPPRYFAAVAYEPVLQRVVVFGGAWGPYRSDTWAWSSGGWTQLTSPTPDQRIQHAAAYDSARQRVVLFGGWFSFPTPFGDTWEWDGSTWSLKSPAASPAPRSGHHMAYDATRQRVVLFGGSFPDAGISAETWEWDGTTWTKRAPALSPPARVFGAMAWDANRQRVTLFGGNVTSAAGFFDDTWEWDGTTWLDVSPPDGGAPGPVARAMHTLVYDAARQRIELFAGYTENGAGLRDLWEWDGTVWVARPQPLQPLPRAMHQAAYDIDRSRTLMFGGWDTLGCHLDDTWEHDGTGWVRRMPLTSPPPTTHGALVYDAARRRAVLVGGADTWLFLP